MHEHQHGHQLDYSSPDPSSWNYSDIQFNGAFWPQQQSYSISSFRIRSNVFKPPHRYNPLWYAYGHSRKIKSLNQTTALLEFPHQLNTSSLFATEFWHQPSITLLSHCWSALYNIQAIPVLFVFLFFRRTFFFSLEAAPSDQQLGTRADHLPPTLGREVSVDIVTLSSRSSLLTS